MNWKASDIFKFLGVVTLFILFLIFLYKLVGVMAWLAAALLITILLSPLVDFFQKYMPRKNRPTAVFATFIAALSIFVLIGFIILPPLFNEFSAMLASTIDSVNALKNSPQFASYYSQLGAVESQIPLASFPEAIGRSLSSLRGGLTGLIAGISSGIFVLITITTLTFFMLLDTQTMMSNVGRFIAPKYRKFYNKLNTSLFTIVSKYFTGVIIVASLAGAAAFIPLYLTNAPYALALAFTIAIFDLIPMVGATIGTIIVALVCLLSGNVTAAVVITLFIIVYQQIENNVVIPLVQKQTVKMTPLAILIALLIGGAIGGVIGTLLAIPAAALIKVIYVEAKEEGYLGGNEDGAE